MEICCARVSDEVQTLLGYYPQELAHRPLYSFIAPTSSEVLARLHRVLLDNVTHVASSVDATWQRTPPTERTTSEKFFSTHPDTLTAIANGSQTVADILWMKRNDGGLEALQAQFYLGGGLGADLYQPTTLGSLYIICLLSRPTRATAAAASVVMTKQKEGAMYVLLTIHSSMFPMLVLLPLLLLPPISLQHHPLIPHHHLFF